MLAKWFKHCPVDARTEASVRLETIRDFLAWPEGVQTLEPLRWAVIGPEETPLLVVAGQLSSEGSDSPMVRRSDRLHQAWVAGVEKADQEGRPPPRHPLGPLVAAWQARPRRLPQQRLIVVRERSPPLGAEPIVLIRQPGVLGLAGAVLEAIEMEGEPFASSEPTVEPGGPLAAIGSANRRRWYQYRVAAVQGSLFPAPRSLDGRLTAGTVLRSLASLDLTGDERSPLRGDVMRIARIAYALVGKTAITEPEGALLIGGGNTPANRRRWRRALLSARALALINPATQRWLPLVDADCDLEGVALVGPPRWWLEKKQPRAFRLTGGLFRSRGEGPQARQHDARYRTLDGLEGALAWGPSAGRGRGGRLPDALRPIRRGGPGERVFVPWWQLLRLAGEPVTSTSGRVAQNRYARRLASLKRAGYFVSGTAASATAPAGDTIELVSRVRAHRERKAGVWIRASARWCAAYAGDRVRIGTSWLLPPKHP